MSEREKFSTQAPPRLLADVRSIAAQEGRQVQSVIEEALSEWVSRKRGAEPRPEILTYLRNTIARNDELYRRLAR